MRLFRREWRASVGISAVSLHGRRVAYGNYGVNGAADCSLPGTANIRTVIDPVAYLQESYAELGDRICYVVGFWIRNFPVHFDANPQLCKLVERLKKMAVDDGISQSAIDDLDVTSM